MRNVDTVLGLSITSNAVGLVLVEGQLADGDIIDREAIEVPADGTATATRAAEQIAAVVSRTHAISALHHLHAVGLTWSDDAANEASLLLESLAEQGFDSVVPVRLPLASEAFAQGIGVVLGYSRTAVCVVETDAALASMVDSRRSEMRTSSCDDVSGASLVEWLTELLTSAEWEPEAVVMVGTSAASSDATPQNSPADLAGVAQKLEASLDIPVFAPAEAELALARGAALASVRYDEFNGGLSGEDFAGIGDFAAAGDVSATAVGAPKRSRSAVLGMTALAAGAVTFVVSLAVAAGMQLAPDRDVRETASRAVVDDTAVAAPSYSVPEAIPSVPVIPEVVPEIADGEVPEVVAEPVVPEEVPVEVPQPEVIAPEAVAEPVYVPEAVPVPEVPVVAPAPVVAPQPAVVPPVQQERPGLLTRIRDRIEAIGQDPAPVQMAPAPVPEVPAPGVVPFP